MSLFHFSPLTWFIRKVVTSITDALVRSPLEEDFGEYSEDDIILPGSRFATTLGLDETIEAKRATPRYRFTPLESSAD